MVRKINTQIFFLLELWGFTSTLLAIARIFCSSFRFLQMIMAMCTGSSWKRSWRWITRPQLLETIQTNSGTTARPGNWPVGSSWFCVCCAAAGSCSPGQSGYAGRQAEPAGHGSEQWPVSPAWPPFPCREAKFYQTQHKRVNLNSDTFSNYLCPTSRCSRSTCSGTGGCP